MLRNIKYTGCMVNHTRESRKIRDKAQYRVPKEEWIIHENAHEAIVSMEEFEAAKDALRKVRPYKKKTERDVYPFYCAHCGRKLQKTFGNDEMCIRDRCLYAGIPFSRTEEQDWILVENTHEAIIEPELFEKVQAINEKAAAAQKANRGKYDHLPKAKNIYGKKFTCADCGSVMKLVRSISTNKDKVYFTFKCPTHEEHGARACTAKRMRKADVDEAVLSSIKAQFELFLDCREALDLSLIHIFRTASTVQNAAQL